MRAPGIVGVALLLVGSHVVATRAAEPLAAPGRIVVRFRDSVTDEADAVFARSGRLRAATRDASDSLDRLNADLGVSRIRALARRALGPRGRADAVRARFPERARRAPVAGTAPDLDRIYVVELPSDADVHAAARRYAADPHVLYAHPDYLVHADVVALPSVPALPSDPYVHLPGTSSWREGAWDQSYPDLWGLQRTHAIEAWNRFASPFAAGSGIVVAVVDTGLDPGHPDIAGGVWTNPGETPGNGIDDDGNGFVDDTGGWDFTTTQGNCEPLGPKPPDADPFDDHFHGTHVAGTIAARANNGIGIAGVAPGATIMPVKALDAGGCGFSSEIAAAIIYAADEGADVINMSIGGPASAVEDDALAYAHGLGAVLVAAAGNAHQDVAAPFRLDPAGSIHVIAVAATDELDQPASFSNYGEKIDVAAPGGGDPLVPPDPPAWTILSLRSSGAGFFSSNDQLYKIVTPDGLYVRLGGTSMAAPHVAGIAALVLASHPTFTNEEVRQAIRTSAVDVGATAGFDVETGTGRVDAERAVATSTVLTAFLDAPAAGAVQAPVTFHGTAAGPGFARWEILVGAGLAPSAFTSLAASTAPVTDGTLFVWAPNEGQYPEGQYTVVLRATDGGGRAFEARHAIVLTHHSLPGWPVADAVTPSIVAVGDVHDTPGDEVVAAGDTSVDRWTSHGEHLASITAAGTVRWLPTLADLNGDGRLEILVGTPAGLLVVDGDTVTTIGTDPLGPMLSGAATPVVVDDMDGDGMPEIVTLDVTGHVAVRDRTGALLPGWPQQPYPPLMPATGVANTDLAVGDLDGDGRKEIVFGVINWFTEPFRLVALHLDGTLAWSRDMVAGQPPGPFVIGLNDVVLGDVDHDGDLDVVFATRDYPGNHFFVLDGGGNVVRDWLVPFTAASIGSTPGASGAIQGPHPILVDLDGDRDLEIVVGAATTDDFRPFVYAWHHDGTPVSGFPSAPAAETGFAVPDYLVAGDVDGDGRVDLVSAMSTKTAAAPGPRLYAWSRSGVPLPGWPTTFPNVSSFGSSFTPNLPALVDLDHDGRLDVVVSVGLNEIAARRLGAPVSRAALQWPHFRHDLGRTGRYDPPPCGNGVLDPGEQCDDGNGVSCDGCSGTCTVDGPPVCGDGVVSLCGEECDDGNVVSGDGCDANCTRTRCGNGVVTGAEECDDGNADAFDGCTTACTRCGNGVVTPPEECDGGLGCTSACTVCGNGVVSPPETCDDGNRTDLDCCSRDCSIEPRGAECSDDGNACTTDTCDPLVGCFHFPVAAQCGYVDPVFGVGIPTTGLTFKDPKGVDTSRRLSFKAVDTTGQGRIFVPDRFGPFDPVEHGALLRVFRPGPYGDAWSGVLPTGGWKVLGSDGQPNGYRYRMSGTRPRTSVTLKAGKLTVKVKSAGFTYSLDERSQGRVVVSLTMGLSPASTDSFELCAEARPRLLGTPPSSATTDVVGRFIGGPSPPPAACPRY